MMEKPIISLIAALGNKNVIGNNHQLPWHLPADLKYFKKTTMGKPIIMGRKTFSAIGRPLPGRQNIVLTREKSFTSAQCDVAHSIAEAIAIAQNKNEIMIIGGAQIYAEFLPFADKLYLTFVHHDFAGDTFFPAWNPDEWQQIESQHFQPDDENKYSYSFIVLGKKP